MGCLGSICALLSTVWLSSKLILGVVILIFAGVIILHISFILNNRRTNQKLAKTNGQLEETNQLKDKFISIISHDLKGPFNGILGLSNYLQEEYDRLSDTEKYELITDINLASKNAYNLLQNLLNWARSQTGSLTYHPSDQNIKQLIDFSLETVQNLARHKQINIKINTNPSLTCYSDENMISTILRNLLSNSIKFSPRYSEITIDAKYHLDHVIISVKDQGIGFTEEETGKLFKLDSHFQKKGTEHETGTGIGLLLCNELVQLCHGELWVNSKPGQGSTFFLSIPKEKNSNL